MNYQRYSHASADRWRQRDGKCQDAGQEQGRIPPGEDPASAVVTAGRRGSSPRVSRKARTFEHSGLARSQFSGPTRRGQSALRCQASFQLGLGPTDGSHASPAEMTSASGAARCTRKTAKPIIRLYCCQQRALRTALRAALPASMLNRVRPRAAEIRSSLSLTASRERLAWL